MMKVCLLSHDPSSDIPDLIEKHFSSAPATVYERAVMYSNKRGRRDNLSYNFKDSKVLREPKYFENMEWVLHCWRIAVLHLKRRLSEICANFYTVLACHS